ncbi:cytochrome c oxidase assembly protein [Lentzea sp. BCCO 10_0061]|uniref:Cytochrome c oxidase assembly protein n=1 Tax=Lentzea sokolovensis TaxID=3095429 RepID=A0ABU4UUV6_9PSEU|nr:cytochrome c oxidase assembly protein [Lentzea sp. BCCO 10_0061]MDX8143244.1 cytochrome c oxidase assembly protein [Lentzea sp. BCCO 10_0061]
MTISTSRRGGRPVAWLAGGTAVGLVLVVALVSGNADAYAAMGLPDPGTVTKIGTYVLRFVADLAAALCAGALCYAAFFVPPKDSGALTADGWSAVRLGGWAAWVWFAAAALLVPFDGAESTGVPVTAVLSPEGLAVVVSVLSEPIAWLVSALVALVVALCCHRVLRWRPAAGLAVVAVMGLLPPVVVGHGSAGLAHDVAMNSLIIHVVTAALWLGVLVCLVLHVRRGTGRPGIAIRRYRRFAFWCWLAVASSGVVAAFTLVTPSQLLTTEYGRATLTKVAVFALLGVLATLARRKRGFVALVVAETVLMLVTVGVSAGMTQPVPPALPGADLSPLQVALGYQLPDPPGALNLLLAWRLDLLLGIGFLIAAAGYVLGLQRLRARGERWPAHRTATWLAGCAVGVMATSSGVGAYAPASFSVHMVMHMALNMIAPLLLVLGAPVTLALRALTEAGGPRKLLVWVLDSRLARTLCHPIVATVVFVVSYYLLYFGGVFEPVMSEHWSRMALSLVVLVSGYLFYWVVVGADPSPGRLPHLGRLGLVFAVMPFHGVFAVILMSTNTVIASNYYRTLVLGWQVDLLADQRLAGVISLVVGELALVAAQVVLLVQWQHHDQLGTFRTLPADLDDEETAAYRAMLTKLRRR